MALLRSFKVDSYQCVDADGGNARYPSVTSLALRMDSTWAPYIQADVTGPPPNPADLTAIDPRNGWRARFTVHSYDENGGQLVATPFDLDIRSRARTHDPRTPGMLLAAASSEARLQDYPFGTLVDSSNDPRSYAATEWALAALQGTGVTLNIVDGSPNGAIPGPDTGWTPDTSVFEYVSTLAEAVGARVYSEAPGVLTWASPTWVADATTRSVDGVTQVVDTISRDDPAWGTFGIVRYAGNSPVAYSTSDSGAQRRKGIVVQRKGRKPGSGNAAAKIRTAAQKRGRNLAVTAIADLTVRPLQNRTIAYEDQSWTTVVQSVAWNFPAGTMQLVLNVIES